MDLSSDCVEDGALLLFLIVVIVVGAGNVVHHALLGNVSSSSCAALDLTSLPLSGSDPLAILRMVLIDGSRVDVLIIVCLQAKESFILGKLIPGASAGRLF